MSTLAKREFNDGCATAHALDIVGERWALLIMRELLLGPKRFSDLRTSLPGISANLLTQRLDGLEAVSVLRRRKLPPPAAAQVYELSEWGLESEEMIKVIGRWAARSPKLSEGRPMSVNSVVLSFRTMFSASRAKRMNTMLGFRFGEEEFVANIADGTLAIERGDVGQCANVVVCDQNALAGVVYGGTPLDEMIADGTIVVEGDLALVRRFCTLFPLPETAPNLANT